MILNNMFLLRLAFLKAETDKKFTMAISILGL